MSWKPTNELRWYREKLGIFRPGHTKPVLQQKWVNQFDDETGDLVLSSSHFKEEWRDVPVVDE